MEQKQQQQIHKIEIQSYNRLIVITPPCYINNNIIEKLQEHFNIDNTQNWQSKKDYESDFSITFMNLAPTKLQSLIKCQTFDKAKFIFFNYQDIKNIVSVIENKRQNYEEMCKTKQNIIWELKSIEPFFKCKSPQGIIQGQLQQIQKFKQNFSQLMYEDPQFLKDPVNQESDDINTTNLIKFFQKLKEETKIINANVVNFLLCISIPCAGKSTLAEQISKIDQNKIQTQTVSNDAIVARVMEALKLEKQKLKNADIIVIDTKKEDNVEIDDNEPEMNDEQAKKILDNINEFDNDIYHEALQKVKAYNYFSGYLCKRLRQVHDNPRHNNLIFIDKNVIPVTLLESIKQCINTRKTQESKPLIRQINLIYPKLYDENNKMENFPFTFQFAIICFKRVLNRINHQTLQGQQELKLAVIIRFLQIFKGCQKFDEEYFKESKNLCHNIIEYPYTTQEQENFEVQEQDKNLIMELINVEKQEESDDIKLKPQIKQLSKALEKYQFQEKNNQQNQEIFNQLIKQIFN